VTERYGYVSEKTTGTLILICAVFVVLTMDWWLGNLQAEFSRLPCLKTMLAMKERHLDSRVARKEVSFVEAYLQDNTPCCVFVSALLT
jgi:hypothetical protein